MNTDQAADGQAAVRLLPPEQRRRWVRGVLSSTALTAAHKTVLLALETYADYRDGTNARPGEANLAENCALTTRAVRAALARAQQLGFIERTAPANSKVGRAAVYRLVLPITTGTAVPVNNPTTGTSVPVESATTGTAVPVDNSTTGTNRRHDRNGHDTTTGTAVPPTLQVPPNHQGVSPDWGTSPAAALAHTDRPPPRFCKRHPRGTLDRCPDCANARTAFEAWQADAAERDIARELAATVDRRRRRQIIDNCPGGCDDYGRDDDLNPCSTCQGGQRHPPHLKLVVGNG